MQGLTNKEYLETILYTRKLELSELNIQNRIDISVYQTRKDIIDREITLIEVQLENSEELK